MEEDYENAAYKYLKALDIKCCDAETLGNLGLALAKTRYTEYAKVAFEEAINERPGSTEILENFMLFLLETRQWD